MAPAVGRAAGNLDPLISLGNPLRLQIVIARIPVRAPCPAVHPAVDQALCLPSSLGRIRDRPVPRRSWQRLDSQPGLRNTSVVDHQPWRGLARLLRTELRRLRLEHSRRRYVGSSISVPCFSARYRHTPSSNPRCWIGLRPRLSCLQPTWVFGRGLRCVSEDGCGDTRLCRSPIAPDAVRGVCLGPSL